MKKKTPKTEKKKVFHLSQSMQVKVLRLNTQVETLSVVTQSLQAQVQSANEKLQSYLGDCRDVLKVPKDFELLDILRGFEKKNGKKKD